MGRPREDIGKRLLRKRVIDSTGCWIWTGCRNWFGYGTIKIPITKPNGMAGKKTVSVHRLAYKEFVGEIAGGLHVLHRCDVPACFNPEHLFLGTPQDNVADMISKGRVGRVVGTDNASSKLKNEDVMEIRRVYAGRTETQGALAERYGVARHHISSITTGRYWKHLPLAA